MDTAGAVTQQGVGGSEVSSLFEELSLRGHERIDGILFDPHDVQNITAAMVSMSRYTDEQRTVMGQRSMEIVSRWTPRHFGEGLFAAIHAARKR